MSNVEKDLKEFKTLYEWLQITRKPNQSLASDIKLIMELIKIPVSND